MDIEELRKRAQAHRSIPSPDRARAIREEAGASIRDVAGVLGVSPTAVWRWEHGNRRPSGRNLERYVDLLEAISS